RSPRTRSARRRRRGASRPATPGFSRWNLAVRRSLSNRRGGWPPGSRSLIHHGSLLVAQAPDEGARFHLQHLDETVHIVRRTSEFFRGAAEFLDMAFAADDRLARLVEGRLAADDRLARLVEGRCDFLNILARLG